jgi:Sec-independent protein secretion pathway component TatC
MTTRYIREAVLRIYYTMLSATITLLCSYYSSEQTTHVPALVRNPDSNPQFTYTESTEASDVSMPLGFAVTLWTPLPPLVPQARQPTKPGLYGHEARSVPRAPIPSLRPPILGPAVSYSFTLPAARKFSLSPEITSTHSRPEARPPTYTRPPSRRSSPRHPTFQVPISVSVCRIPWFRFRKFVHPILAVPGAPAPDIASQLVLVIGAISSYEITRVAIKAH